MKKIKLSKGYALVDEEDYEKINNLGKWTNNQGYAKRAMVFIRCGEKITKTVSMHRLIMDAKTGEQVDHINGNRLDNRKSNLRIVNHTQNQWNRGALKNSSSKYKGVKYRTNCRNGHKPWRASITHNKKQHMLGCFFTQEEAALTYNYYAKKYFGEHARLNEVPGYE